MQKATVFQGATLTILRRGRRRPRCRRQHSGQGPGGLRSGYLQCLFLFWGGGFKPVQNSEHATDRLLAPAQSPVGAATRHVAIGVDGGSHIICI